MATSDILGLFMSPEQYQAQQMAQQQAAEQQRAFNFAQLSPRDQAVYSTFLGAQQLGRGLGGLLGVQDPQLQRIRQRQEIMQSINPADMTSLEQGILRASQAGDSELALTLADYARNAASNIALTKQREMEKVPQDIQIAARIRQLTADRLKLPENERGPIDAEIKRLERLSKPGATDKVEQLRDLYLAEEEAVRKAQAKAAPSQTTGLDGQPLTTRAAVNVDDDPEVRAIRSLIRVATGDKEGKEIEVVAKATALADTVSSDRNSAVWKEKYKTELTRLTADKTEVEKPTEAERNAKIFAKNSGFAEGSEGFNKAFSTKFAELIGKSEAAKPTEAERNATIFAKNSGFAEGSEGYNKVFKEKFAELIGKSSGAPIKEVVLAKKIVELDTFIRNAKDPTAPDVVDAKTEAQLYRDAMKRERPNIDTLGLAKGGKYDGQPVFLDETSRKTFVFDTDKAGKQIEVPYTGGLKGLKGGTEVNVGGSKVVVDTSETGKAAGKELGKELITVKDKQSAIDSIQDALSILNQGIYAGPYSQLRKGAAKYLGVGNSDKVARTEEFMSYIGDVVVARLKDFGGNDSEQELAYLNRIIGGDLEVEPKALKRILERAEAKIRRGIERLRRQAVSGERKESLTTTLPEAEAAAAPRKPTRRYNPVTKKLEVIQ